MYSAKVLSSVLSHLQMLPVTVTQYHGPRGFLSLNSFLVGGKEELLFVLFPPSYLRVLNRKYGKKKKTSTIRNYEGKVKSFSKQDCH